MTCIAASFRPTFSLLCGLLLAGCTSITERYTDGKLVSRQTITWSISPRSVETTPATSTIIVTDTAESLRAAGELVGTAAAAAAKGAIAP